jgi:hypothetical protein
LDTREIVLIGDSVYVCQTLSSNGVINTVDRCRLQARFADGCFDVIAPAPGGAGLGGQDHEFGARADREHIAVEVVDLLCALPVAEVSLREVLQRVALAECVQQRPQTGGRVAGQEESLTTVDAVPVVYIVAV